MASIPLLVWVLVQAALCTAADSAAPSKAPHSTAPTAPTPEHVQPHLPPIDPFGPGGYCGSRDQHESHRHNLKNASLWCLQTALTGNLDGELLYRIDKAEKLDYNRATSIDNNYCKVYPVVVVSALSENDVALSIAAALNCSVEFSVDSGGHSAAGYGLNNEFVLDMRRMNHTKIDSKTGRLTVGGGSRYTHVYDAVLSSNREYQTGWVPIGGGCPQVGVAGYTLGGGWSFLSRSYGLAIDNLISVTLVLANSSVVTVGAKECENNTSCNDLWWSVRGGGGGNFGVATQFVFQMQKPVEFMQVGQLCWEPFADEIYSVWKVYLDRLTTLPEWLQIDPAWLPLGENATRLMCMTVICNQDYAACRKETDRYVDMK